MEDLIKIWCQDHPSVVEYSIPNFPVLISQNALPMWELRAEDQADFADWFPIYVNGTGVNYTVYYYNCNKESENHGKILGMWCHCFSGDIQIKHIADSVKDFLEIPKYQSMIGRRDNYSNGLKLSIMSDFEL